ncbi:MAG: PAS domain S-box protein [Bacteroidetes bacterium]|jgi:PAS domain S-box-containing protein|nr:PAS domain S-box protein [Bacteroidota bacterium]
MSAFFALLMPLVPLAVPLALSTFWIFIAGGVLLLALGVVIGWFLTQSTRARHDRLDTLFVENPEPLILTNLHWKIVDANEAACDLFGYTRDQISLLTLKRLMHTKEALEPEDVLERLEQEPTLQYEATVVREGEGLADLAVSTRKVVLDEQPYLLTALHNITRQKADERLFKHFHEELVKDVPVEVAVLTAQGQYVYANEAATGGDPHTRDALLGNTDIEYCQEMGMHPEIALRRRSHRREAVDSKTTVSFEETLPTKNGDARYITRIYKPILDEDDTVSAIAMYGVEMTHLKQHQDQVQDVLQEAERVTRIKDTFLKNISNEFRAPLNGILSASEVLHDDLGDQHAEFIDIIQRNGRRLMTTLNAMIDLARLHAELLDMSPRVVNLVGEVKKVGRTLATMAKEKGLFLRMRATKSEMLVRADRSGLYRALENLVRNAIKFTESGGVLVEVDGGEDEAYVRVMDTGVGIRNEFLPHLFDEFNQESDGNALDFEGVGIGLTVTKRLVDLMGGSITVNTQEGEGTMFTITLPAAFSQHKDGKGLQVLLADAHAESRRVIQHILSPYVDLSEASSLEDALSLAKKRSFDVVLLDVDLESPSLGAADVLEALRNVNGYDDTSIIALDPHGHPGAETQFSATGYDGALSKPIERGELLDVLGRVTPRAPEHAPAMTEVAAA